MWTALGIACILAVVPTTHGGCSQGPAVTFSVEQHLISAHDYSNITPDNRTFCPATDENTPPNRVNSTLTLAALRETMANHDPPLDAYLVEYRDDHGSGGADHDMRMEYLSGYSGSSGFIWVTADRAALWTDGRYFLQGEQQLDCQWILMRQGVQGYPSAGDWLLDVLEDGANAGSDPRFVSISAWTSYSTVLSEGNINMVEVDDLFDEIWTDGRPKRPNGQLIIHPLEYTGESIEQKIDRVRAKLDEYEADALVLSALDDTAWTFNLRGSDRATSSLFYSYAIITQSYVSLYMANFTNLINREDVQDHLNTNSDGTCSGLDGLCVQVKEYGQIIEDLIALKEQEDINKIWLSPSSNYATLSAISGKEMLYESPTQLMKSVKNQVERRRYKECQIRDSAAVCRFAAFLEKEIADGNEWTEITASEKLFSIRQEDPVFFRVSFETISAVGENAAVIHYRPTEFTDKKINKDDVFLLDSGGQYMDGTTDVTRTFHFGAPENVVKEAYTRVLMGAIELSETVWPFGLHGSEIDVRARTPLYQNGWDYRHGTGHGIGYWLNVHEGPGTIRMGFRPEHQALHEGQFYSDEPGFYEDGHFGIRLETIVGIEKANTPNNFGDAEYLTMKEVTLVPFEPNLIKYELLDIHHRKWLNHYHQRCIDETGKFLLDNGHQDAYDWLLSKAAPIPETPDWRTDSASFKSANQLAILVTALFLMVFFHH